MDERALMQRVLSEYGLRIGRESAGYLGRRLGAGPAAGEIPLMGGDARTGVAKRMLIDARRLDVLLAARGGADS